MQDLCVFAHALEVSVRENQRIRWRIVHGGDKGNKPPAFCVPLVYLWYRIYYLRVRLLLREHCDIFIAVLPYLWLLLSFVCLRTIKLFTPLLN